MTLGEEMSLCLFLYVIFKYPITYLRPEDITISGVPNLVLVHIYSSFYPNQILTKQGEFLHPLYAPMSKHHNSILILAFYIRQSGWFSDQRLPCRDIRHGRLAAILVAETLDYGCNAEDVFTIGEYRWWAWDAKARQVDWQSDQHAAVEAAVRERTVVISCRCRGKALLFEDTLDEGRVGAFGRVSGMA
jgi:hypothetical protein